MAGAAGARSERDELASDFMTTRGPRATRPLPTLLPCVLASRPLSCVQPAVPGCKRLQRVTLSKTLTLALSRSARWPTFRSPSGSSAARSSEGNRVLPFVLGDEPASPPTASRTRRLRKDPDRSTARDAVRPAPDLCKHRLDRRRSLCGHLRRLDEVDELVPHRIQQPCSSTRQPAGQPASSCS